MSEQENLDIGKVVGLIMENPQLIEQISNLARQNKDTSQKEQAISEPAAQENEIQASASATYAPQRTMSRGNRAQLLGALKPYMSEERARAIDSMITIADVLEIMKAR